MVEVVDYLRITGQFLPALREVVQRKITAGAAKRARMKVSTRELQRAADAFRVAHGLNKAKDTDEWFESNGISVEAFEEYLQTNLLINKYKNNLEKKVSKRKYLESQMVKESVRELIYQDWPQKQMK